MVNDIKAEIAEVIKKNSISGTEGGVGISANLITLDEIDQAAQEIVSLFESSDTTLTRLAADLGVPLNVAMKLADYGKKAMMAKVEEMIPKEMKPTGEYDMQAGGFNACRDELRQALGLVKGG